MCSITVVPHATINLGCFIYTGIPETDSAWFCSNHGQYVPIFIPVQAYTPSWWSNRSMVKAQGNILWTSHINITKKQKIWPRTHPGRLISAYLCPCRSNICTVLSWLYKKKHFKQWYDDVLHKGKRFLRLSHSTYSLLTLQQRYNCQGFSAICTIGWHLPRFSHLRWKCSVSKRYANSKFVMFLRHKPKLYEKASSPCNFLQYLLN